MKKKMISTVLCAAMVAVSLAGCGGSKPAETKAATEAAKETTKAAEKAETTAAASAYQQIAMGLFPMPVLADAISIKINLLNSEPRLHIT